MRFAPDRSGHGWTRDFRSPPNGPAGGDAGRDGRSPDSAEARFIAICEVGRFEAIRRNIGYARAHALLSRLATTIEAGLDGVEIGRVQRASIEFLFRAGDGREAEAHLRRIAAACEAPLRIDGCTFTLATRFGYAPVDAALTGNELIERIEVTLEAAEHAAARIVYASREIAEHTTLRLGLLRDLHAAIETDALDLHYQPKLRCRTQRIDAVEALLRWTHPQLGPVSPDAFVTMAEETGVIRALTDWVLRRAIRDQRRLAEAGHALTVYVNVSGLGLPDPDFAEMAIGLLAETPGAIGFEITETAVIDDPDRALAHLRAFTDAGIRIAIDDYGSGLSSLAYLKQLPANELKIDKLFISGLTTSHRDPLLVRSSIDLAHALEMEVTAEGVDNPLAMSLLGVMGCDSVQGYLLAPAMPADELVTFLERGDWVDRIAAQSPPRFGIIR